MDEKVTGHGYRLEIVMAFIPSIWDLTEDRKSITVSNVSWREHFPRIDDRLPLSDRGRGKWR